MQSWRHIRRARLICQGGRQRSLQDARYHGFSPFLHVEDLHLGPMPVEPLCYTIGTDPDEKGQIRSAMINPEAPTGVSEFRDKRALIFSSIEAAKERMNTVLHLQGASPNLNLVDIKRIFPEGKHIPGWRSEGGLLKAIPVRHSRTLERMDSWLLVFSTPYYAALYHSRLSWYHTNAKVNSPLSPAEQAERIHDEKPYPHKPQYPVTSLIPGSVDLMNKDKPYERVQEYTIFSPRTRPVIHYYIPPFHDRILDNLWWHHRWTRPDATGVIAYPVMVSITPAQKWFGGHTIWRLIKRDGERRGLPWPVFDSEFGVQRVIWGTGSKWDTYDKAVYDDEAGGVRHPDQMQEKLAMDRNKWMIRFKDEDEARRFIRKWNRRLWDPEGNWAGDHDFNPATLLKVDQLW